MPITSHCNLMYYDFIFKFLKWFAKSTVIFIADSESMDHEWPRWPSMTQEWFHRIMASEGVIGGHRSHTWFMLVFSVWYWEKVTIF